MKVSERRRALRDVGKGSRSLYHQVTIDEWLLNHQLVISSSAGGADLELENHQLVISSSVGGADLELENHQLVISSSDSSVKVVRRSARRVR